MAAFAEPMSRGTETSIVRHEPPRFGLNSCQESAHPLGNLWIPVGYNYVGYVCLRACKKEFAASSRGGL